jgi:hypothetical protein
LDAKKKNTVLTVISLLAILVAGASIYSYLRKPKSDFNPALHQAIGEAVAEETIKAAGNNGQIILITLEKGQSPELDAHVAAFKDRIYDVHLTVARHDTISTEKSAKFGPGAGMSGKRFVRLVEKYKDVAAIVSFVGVPNPGDKELKTIAPPVPKFIAFSRTSDHVGDLVKNKMLYAAVVPRFDFPAPGPEKPKTKQEWFTKYYQVVRADTSQPEK